MTVVPQTFELVQFDADEIEAAFVEMAAQVPGLPANLTAEIQVDEEISTTRMAVASVEPLVLTLESGALENLKQPRTFGEVAAANSFGRLLFEVADRLSPEFGAPEIGEPSDLGQRVAWDAYCHGRVARLGVRTYKPKYIYNFRNRHGFTDAADATFETLWSASDLTWADIVELC